MIAEAFDYERADSLEAALAALARRPGAKVLAGGHSLLPLLKLRLAQVPLLVDIDGVGELGGVRVEDGDLVVGALARHRDVADSEAVRRGWTALAQAASHVGDPQVRNRGTVGGNLAHGDPASDLPTAVLLFDGVLTVASGAGLRQVSARDFWLGPFATALGEGEILTAVRMAPLGDRAASAYRKFPHPASGYAVVSVAAAVRLDGEGRVAEARVAVGGATYVPFRAAAAEAAMVGVRPDPPACREAVADLFAGQEPAGDMYASADYRAHIARLYAADALAAAGAAAAAG